VADHLDSQNIVLVVHEGDVVTTPDPNHHYRIDDAFGTEL